MDIDFWPSVENSRAIKDIKALAKKDPESALKIWQLIDNDLSKYSMSQLIKVHTIEKIEGRNPYKVYELRMNLKGKIARFLGIIESDKFMVIHFFIKKTNKILKEDIELAESIIKRFK